MTVNTTNITSGPYTGNDVSDTFDYTFRVTDKNQLTVFETDTSGVRTTLTVDTDYTVNDIGNDAGGTITRTAGALPTGYTWYIRSNYKQTQTTALSSQGAFFPDVHEDALDKLTFLVQQLEDTLGRSFRLSDEIDNDGNFIIDKDALGRATTVLAFDANGDIVLLDQTTVNTIPAVLTQTVTLADGQTSVTFTSSVENASFYISGNLADNGRLTEGTDYTVNITTDVLTLTDSYPAGTLITLVYNDVGSSALTGFRQDFSTVTQLKASSLSTGLTVTTQGYHAAGDGGHAEYYIQSAGDYGATPDEYSDHTLANGNVAVLQNRERSNAITLGQSAGSMNIYVATTGSDSNHGWDASNPLLTIQAAIDKFEVFAAFTGDQWTIHLADGTYTDGGVFDQILTAKEIIVEGESKAGTILDGTSATTVMGLNFNACTPSRVKNLTVQNWGGVGSGVIFQNGTRGVVDTVTCDANAEANFNCSEDSEIVMIGACSATGTSKFGIRVYRNSGGSIGDGTNAITINGATQSGIVARDGSKVVCQNNLTVTNCSSTSTTAGIRAQKDGYVELRDCSITNNSLGIVAENNSIVDTQSGTRTLSGNTQDYRITDNSNDRSLYSSAGDVMQHWKPRSNPSGLSVSSNYDLVLDYNGATGFQFLTNGNNVNVDFDKVSRITYVASDSSVRVTAGSGNEYRYTTAALQPGSDNLKNLGQSFARWATVYAGTGTINTSDQREKMDERSLSEVEKAVALKIKGMMKAFRFKDAVEKKGDKARIHFGAMAQDVAAAFSSEGLDPHNYALFCYDKWDAYDEIIPAEYESRLYVDEVTSEEITKEVLVKEEQTVHYPEGDRYGLRYEELLAFIIASM